jgi:hypothetical protein
MTSPTASPELAAGSSGSRPTTYGRSPPARRMPSFDAALGFVRKRLRLMKSCQGGARGGEKGGRCFWGFISGVVRSDHISTCAGGNRQRSSCGREVEPLRGFGWGARCLPRPVLLRRDRAATHAHVAQPRSLLGIQLGCERQRVRRLWRRQLARAPEAVAGRPVAPRLSPKECRATPSRQARPEEA